MAFAFWKPVCYVLGANRRVSAGSRRVFYFPSPTFPPSNHKSIAVLSFAIEYISARIAFPSPRLLFPCIQISATSILLWHQTRYKYSPIRDACRMAKNIVKGYYNNTSSFFSPPVKCKYALHYFVKFCYCIATIILFQAFNQTIFYRLIIISLYSEINYTFKRVLKKYRKLNFKHIIITRKF